MQIKKLSGGWLWLVLFTACSSSEGGPKQVGGGQSGTDSQGAYTCQLDSPTVESIPVDTPPSGVSCSPNSEWAQLEGSRTFRCSEHDVSFTVNVARGLSARRLTGRLSSDTDPSAPPTDCYAMSLDSSVAIEASDDGVAYDGPTTLTVDHLCNSASVDARVQGSAGEYRFEFWQQDLFVTFPNLENEHCLLPSDPPAESNASGGKGL
ncbi:MAG TPA: hypothetical protein VER96_18190 [Polyangiaceae bacterium]|nr:hypothetical protein [Polyangiaceae bacterium]